MIAILFIQFDAFTSQGKLDTLGKLIVNLFNGGAFGFDADSFCNFI